MFRMILDDGWISIDAKVQPVQISLLLFRRKIKPGITVFQLLIAVQRQVIAISIRPYMKPDKTECVRRMIRIAEFHQRIERFFSRFKLYLNIVSERLLPSRLPPGHQDKK